MTAFTRTRRTRAAALLGGVALITGTVAGTATAAPAPAGEPDRTIVVCTAPGGELRPAAPTASAPQFQRTVPAGPDAEFRPAEPRILIERGAPGQPPLDGAECVRIDQADIAPAHPAVPGVPALPLPR